MTGLPIFRRNHFCTSSGGRNYYRYKSGNFKSRVHRIIPIKSRIQFVTSFEGYRAWGFPQKFDKVGINLTSEEYAEELDEFIYSKLSSEMGVTYVSMSED